MTKAIPGQSSLWHNFFRKKSEEDNSLEALLSGVAIFSGLKKRELSRLASLVHRRHYSANERIFTQGDPGLGMYVVDQGQVEILMTRGDGEKESLAVLMPGDFFGELSLLDESPRSASAIAGVDSSIIGFFRPDLIDLLNRSPKIGSKILFKLGEIIGARLRITNEQLARKCAELEATTNKREGGRNVNRQP